MWSNGLTSTSETAITSSIVAMLLGTTTGIVAYEMSQDLADELSFGTMGMSSIFDFEAFLDSVELYQSGARAYHLAETLMVTAAANTLFSIQANAVAKCKSYIDVLMEHAAKYATGTPNGCPDPGWRNEITKWLKKIAKLAKDMQGNTQQKWQRYVDDFFRWLEKPLGPPPQAPA